MSMIKKWHESKKWLCYFLTTAILSIIALFMVWKGMEWPAVAVTGMIATISAVLILGQASVDKILYRGGQIVAAARSGEHPDEED